MSKYTYDLLEQYGKDNNIHCIKTPLELFN